MPSSTPRRAASPAGSWPQAIGHGDLVAVAVERSPETIVGFLAALKAGAAYLPLDPAYPDARLAADARRTPRPAAAIASGDDCRRLSALAPGITVLDVDDAGADAARAHGAAELRGEPRLRDVHLGLDRRAQGRRGPAPRRPPRGARQRLSPAHPERRRPEPQPARLRRVGPRRLRSAAPRRAAHPAPRRDPVARDGAAPGPLARPDRPPRAHAGVPRARRGRARRVRERPPYLRRRRRALAGPAPSGPSPS